MNHITTHFTEEEKRHFFEEAGFLTAEKEYKRWVRLTHGWYEEETYTAESVSVEGKWYKINELFDEVMRKRIVSIFLAKNISTNILIREVCKERK